MSLLLKESQEKLVFCCVQINCNYFYDFHSSHENINLRTYLRNRSDIPFTERRVILGWHNAFIRLIFFLQSSVEGIIEIGQFESIVSFSKVRSVEKSIPTSAFQISFRLLSLHETTSRE